MNNKKVLSFAGGIALIVAGLLALFIGVVVALIVGSEWLLLSLVGLASVIAGGVIISREARNIIRSVKSSMPEHVRSKIKK